MSTSPRRDQHPTIDTLIALAQQTKDTHRQVAATMDRLAQHGEPEVQRRRRELADRARGRAEMEAHHIAVWSARQAGPLHS